ncbi:MAG TPA: hypothetical protein VIA10_12760 [Gaiellaceae bacterium]
MSSKAWLDPQLALLEARREERRQAERLAAQLRERAAAEEPADGTHEAAAGADAA